MKGKNWEYSVFRYLHYMSSGTILECHLHYLKLYIANSNTIFKKYKRKYFHMLREDITWNHVKVTIKEIGRMCKQNYGGGTKIRVCHVLEAKGGISGPLRIFRRKNTPVYDTIRVDTCHYIFAQIHKMYKTKNKLKYKL